MNGAHTLRRSSERKSIVTSNGFDEDNGFGYSPNKSLATNPEAHPEVGRME